MIKIISFLPAKAVHLASTMNGWPSKILALTKNWLDPVVPPKNWTTYKWNNWPWQKKTNLQLEQLVSCNKKSCIKQTWPEPTNSQYKQVGFLFFKILPRASILFWFDCATVFNQAASALVISIFKSFAVDKFLSLQLFNLNLLCKVFLILFDCATKQ